MEERGGEKELRGVGVGETVVGIYDTRDESVLNKIKIKTRKPAERVIRSKSVRGTPHVPCDSSCIQIPV